MHELPSDTDAIVEDDAFIAAALEHASAPTLLMSIVHLTGETGVLDGAIRPQPAVMGDTQGSMTEDDKAAVRGLAEPAPIVPVLIGGEERASLVGTLAAAEGLNLDLAQCPALGTGASRALLHVKARHNAKQVLDAAHKLAAAARGAGTSPGATQ